MTRWGLSVASVLHISRLKTVGIFILAMTTMSKKPCVVHHSQDQTTADSIRLGDSSSSWTCCHWIRRGINLCWQLWKPNDLWSRDIITMAEYIAMDASLHHWTRPLILIFLGVYRHVTTNTSGKIDLVADYPTILQVISSYMVPLWSTV